LVIAARFISRMGGFAAFFVGLWGKAAYEFAATPTQLAVVMAVLGVASLTGSAIAGTLIDRYGPRRVLIASEVLFAPATLSAILVTDMASLSLVAFAIGFFGSPTYAAITSFPAFLTDDESMLAKLNSGWRRRARQPSSGVPPSAGRWPDGCRSTPYSGSTPSRHSWA
jgi:MFS family permease